MKQVFKIVYANSGVACLSAARGGPRICRPLLLHDPFPSRPPLPRHPLGPAKVYVEGWIAAKCQRLHLKWQFCLIVLIIWLCVNVWWLITNFKTVTRKSWNFFFIYPFGRPCKGAARGGPPPAAPLDTPLCIYFETPRRKCSYWCMIWNPRTWSGLLDMLRIVDPASRSCYSR